MEWRPGCFDTHEPSASILAAVARYGVLTSEQIARLDGGSRQKIVRFLQHLVELKLLRRAARAPDPFLTSFFDARPRAFVVTAKGLRVLAAARMPINVTPKKANVLLAHEIETAECMFAFNAAVAAHGAVRLIDEPELIGVMPPATQALPKPLRLEAAAYPREFPHLREILKEPTVIGTEPDRLFALATLPENLGWSFALELDRGTEDVTARRIRGRATYTRKVLGYFSAWRDGRHVAQWGDVCKAFRVLVVTTSAARIGNMIAVQDYIGAPHGLFLYSTPDRLARVGALGPAWSGAKRDGVSLLDRD
jgi:hypothetical protein